MVPNKCELANIYESLDSNPSTQSFDRRKKMPSQDSFVLRGLSVTAS